MLSSLPQSAMLTVPSSEGANALTNNFDSSKGPVPQGTGPSAIQETACHAALCLAMTW